MSSQSTIEVLEGEDVRGAVVRPAAGTETSALEFCPMVEAHLPINYRTIGEGWDGNYYVLVAGADRAGWTLADYVIPRLATGLCWAKEVAIDTRVLAEIEEIAIDLTRADAIAALIRPRPE